VTITLLMGGPMPKNPELQKDIKDTSIHQRMNFAKGVQRSTSMRHSQDRITRSAATRREPGSRFGLGYRILLSSSLLATALPPQHQRKPRGPTHSDRILPQ